MTALAPWCYYFPVLLEQQPYIYFIIILHYHYYHSSKQPFFYNTQYSEAKNKLFIICRNLFKCA